MLFIGDELFNGLGVPTKARPRRSVGLGDKALDGLFEPFMGVIGGFGPPIEPREASPRRRRGFGNGERSKVVSDTPDNGEDIL